MAAIKVSLQVEARLIEEQQQTDLSVAREVEEKRISSISESYRNLLYELRSLQQTQLKTLNQRHEQLLSGIQAVILNLESEIAECETAISNSRSKKEHTLLTLRLARSKQILETDARHRSDIERRLAQMQSDELLTELSRAELLDELLQAQENEREHHRKQFSTNLACLRDDLTCITGLEEVKTRITSARAEEGRIQETIEAEKGWICFAHETMNFMLYKDRARIGAQGNWVRDKFKVENQMRSIRHPTQDHDQAMGQPSTTLWTRYRD